MVGTLFYSILFIASSAGIYAFGVFRLLPHLAGINAFSPSLLSFAFVIMSCFGIAACMDKIFYYFEDGHNKFKSVGDDVERHPLIQALVLSIIVSMVLFFLLALTTKTLGNPYEETVVAERIAPVHCRRYTLCSRRGANFIVGRFSGPTTSIRVNHQTYEILKRHSVRSLFITGHSGIFGSTVETYKISPTAK